MSKQRKAIVVHVTPGTESASLAELNDLLNDDWRLMSAAAMGGSGEGFASLVLLEREDKKTVGGFTA